MGNLQTTAGIKSQKPLSGCNFPYSYGFTLIFFFLCVSYYFFLYIFSFANLVKTLGTMSTLSWGEELKKKKIFFSRFDSKTMRFFLCEKDGRVKSYP